MAVTMEQVAARVGLPSRPVRYYDRIGLVRANEAQHVRLPPLRAGRGGCASSATRRRSGFSLDEIRGLLAAAEGGCGATVPELGRQLDQKVAEIDVKMAEFVAFRERLVEYRTGKRSHDRGCCGDGAFGNCLDDVPEP